MPTRLLHESICTSETLDRMSCFEQNVFMRLIVHCDDYGCMDGRTRLLQSKLYPLGGPGEEQLEEALRTLEKADSIRFYQVEGRRYLYLPKWETYQKIRTRRHKYPPPPLEGESASRGRAPAQRIQSNPNPESKPESETFSPESPPEGGRPEMRAKGEESVFEAEARSGEVTEQLLEALNQKAGTRYRSKNRQTRLLVAEKLEQGYTPGEMMQVVEDKAAQWLHPEPGERNMSRYYRPSTLFGQHFPEYAGKTRTAAPNGSKGQQTASSIDMAELEELVRAGRGSPFPQK